MSFKRLQIRYQTARSLPAPYAYYYTLNANPVGAAAVQIELSIKYPDRDDIDEDELIAEGYTRNDDFSWSGQLPKTWLDSIDSLVTKTTIQAVDESELGEDDDFWAIVIETKNTQEGVPNNADQWQYLMQELIQATYEAVGRERPFELTYLDLNDRQGDQEIRLTASFVQRTISVSNTQNRREHSKTISWATLQPIMGQVYEHEFSLDDTQFKRPKREGRWLNLGGDEWYDISNLRKLTTRLQNL